MKESVRGAQPMFENVKDKTLIEDENNKKKTQYPTPSPKAKNRPVLKTNVSKSRSLNYKVNASKTICSHSCEYYPDQTWLV